MTPIAGVSSIPTGNVRKFITRANPNNTSPCNWLLSAVPGAASMETSDTKTQVRADKQIAIQPNPKPFAIKGDNSALTVIVAGPEQVDVGWPQKNLMSPYDLPPTRLNIGCDLGPPKALALDPNHFNPIIAVLHRMPKHCRQNVNGAGGHARPGPS